MHNYVVHKANGTHINVLAAGFSQHGDGVTFYRHIDDNGDGFSPTYNVLWVRVEDVEYVTIDESIEI